jgi:hypothetical protein
VTKTWRDDEHHKDYVECLTGKVDTATVDGNYIGNQGVSFTPYSTYNYDTARSDSSSEIIVAHNHHEMWKMGVRNNPTAEAEPDILPNESSAMV